MYHVRILLACAALGFLVCAPIMVQAQTSPSNVERQMSKQGYLVLYSETTWLGRVRILAVRDDNLREVVIGPGTGEILRDVVYEIPGLAAMIADAQNAKGGSRTVDLSDFGGPSGVSVGHGPKGLADQHDPNAAASVGDTLGGPAGETDVLQ